VSAAILRSWNNFTNAAPFASNRNASRERALNCVLGA